LTTERRQEYIKLIRRKAEEARVAVRNVRREKMAEIKKNFDNKLLSEDEEFKAEQDLQKITDEYIGRIDEAGRKKEEELLQI
jgi:ribosome recycling factor